MKLVKNLRTAKLPLRVVFPVVAVALAATAYVENTALKKLDAPPPPKTSCVKCHVDKKTLAAIVEKSGDALYLVHSGDLTLEQLRALEKAKPAVRK